MLISLPGYDLQELIYEGLSNLIYRGKRIGDGMAVIIKIQKSEHPSPKLKARIRHEFEMLQILRSKNVIQAYGLEQFYERLGLILEDCKAISLDMILKKSRLDIKTSLGIAIETAKGIADIHQQNIIHKDIKPHNILVNLESGQVKIIDLGISSTLPREILEITNLNFLEGTLAYLSPEQTGRINRTIDYRTDLYSFGVTLYEMFCGQLPFQTPDKNEMIYSHLAKSPLSPIEIDPQIPQPLSEIIMKCLEKNAEDRYKSAFGLKADLEECLAQFNVMGTIEHFSIAEHDVFDRFRIPQKLYGRDEEIHVLQNMIDLAANDNNACLLITGEAGIGKSSLVNEIQKPIVERNGIFIRGKFEQFKRNIPYSAIIQSLNSLIRQMLTANEQTLTNLKLALLDALGDEGLLIVDLIPEIELIIGKQPAVEQLDPQSADNRLKSLFARFIGTFLTEDRPLAIFLDDFQWADLSSMQFIQDLIVEDEVKHLLLICSYRDNEIDPSHPLIPFLEKIRKSRCFIEQIKVKPLSKSSLEILVSDAFQEKLEHSKDLAELIYRKTHGNPFFATQFLKDLYETNLINFNYEKQMWTAELERIANLQVSENVADLVIKKILQLPKGTQEAIKQASAIGTAFDLSILSPILNMPIEKTTQELRPALENELIVQKRNIKIQGEAFQEIKYAFQHDRIQQAAYELIPEPERPYIHQLIGKILLRQHPIEKNQELIIPIVNQLNHGKMLPQPQEEIIKLAQLNLAAGIQAINSASYHSAIEYIQTSMELLPSNSWKELYPLTFSIYEHLGICKQMTGDWKEAEKILKCLIENANTSQEKIKILILLIHLYFGMNKQTADLCRQALLFFGVKMPSAHETLKLGLLQIKGRWGLFLVNHYKGLLLSFAEPNEELFQKVACVAILSFWNSDSIEVLEAFKSLAFWRVVKSGISNYSSYIIAAYAGVLMSKNYELYAEAGSMIRLAIKTGKKFPLSGANSQGLVTAYSFRYHLAEDIKTAIPELKILERRCFEAGVVLYAGVAVKAISFYNLMKGEPLKLAYDEIEKDLLRAKKYNLYSYWSIVLIKQTILALRGKIENPCLPLPKEPEELCQILSSPIDKNNAQVHFFNLCWSIFLHYHQGKYDDAMIYFHQLQKYPDVANGDPHWVIVEFYTALSMTAICLDYPLKKKEYSKPIKNYLVQFKLFAKACPPNHLQKYQLLAAEYSALLGKKSAAIGLYQQSILNACKNGFLNDEALAYECLSKFYIKLNELRLAAIFMQEAYHAYSRWGAVSKLKFLQERYGALLEGILQNENPETVLSTQPVKDQEQYTMTTSTSGDSLDIQSILEASQAFLSEVVLDKLLSKLMRILIANAGANRAYLLLYAQNRLLVQAEHDSVLGPPLVLQAKPVEQLENSICLPILNYVARSQNSMLLNNVQEEGPFIHDPYIKTNKPLSVLCMPLKYFGKMSGILYLENTLNKDAFNLKRMQLLTALTSQMIIAIENSLLYSKLEEKVEERTKELKIAQAKLVEQEKMASLGLLTSGIAHEISNPLNFIKNFSELSEETTNKDLVELFDQLSNVVDDKKFTEIKELILSLGSNLKIINENSKRIDGIVKKMMHYSSILPGEHALTDVHSLIETAVTQTYKLFKEKNPSSDISIRKNFDTHVKQAKLSPSGIHRVLEYLLQNAFISVNQKRNEIGESYHPVVEVITLHLGKELQIKIKDNGKGIPESLVKKIFTPFVTTRPPGEGTGLALSIAYGIVVQQHGGSLTFNSRENEFAEFIITIPLI